MILLTRLNGQHFAINPDHIERVDANPDTVVTLFEGTKYVVTESIDVVIERIAGFRARVLSLAAQPDVGDVPTGTTATRGELRLVTGKD
ncbi:MAG: flagellar FlbD family protein [Acidimicrobiales bacterium]